MRVAGGPYPTHVTGTDPGDYYGAGSGSPHGGGSVGRMAMSGALAAGPTGMYC